MRTTYDTLLAIFIIIFAYPECAISQQSNHNSDISGVRISERLPIQSDTGIIHYSNGTVDIYTLATIKLYKMSYKFDSVGPNNKLVQETRFRIFVCDTVTNLGYEFNPQNLSSKKQISRKDALKNQWFVITDLYPIFLNFKVRVVKSKRDKNELYEVYEFRHKKDNALIETWKVNYSDKLKTVNETLCRQLDSTKKTKAYRIDVQSYDYYFKEYRFKMNAGKTLYTLEKITEIPTEIRRYFDEFKQ